MQIPIEQLLNLPDIQVLNVEITDREIKCDIESTRGYSIWRRRRQKGAKFFEHAETLTLRTSFISRAEASPTAPHNSFIKFLVTRARAVEHKIEM